MKMSCLLGSHWPEAAFSPNRIGYQRSRCADCGRAMHKPSEGDWRAISTFDPAMERLSA